MDVTTAMMVTVQMSCCVLTQPVDHPLSSVARPLSVYKDPGSVMETTTVKTEVMRSRQYVSPVVRALQVCLSLANLPFILFVIVVSQKNDGLTII